MVANFETVTFAIGDDVAVELPPDIGIAAGGPIWIERVGDHLRIYLTKPDEPEAGQPHFCSSKPQ